MIRKKRSDTLVSSVESTYGISLNARSDMHLGTLLRKRGYSTQNELLKAARGHLQYNPKRRKVFLSFHVEDIQQVRGFRLMASNPNINIDLDDRGLQSEIDSENNSYVKKAIREKIRHTEVLACLIGNGTAWRKWVEWEIQTAAELKKGICGIMLKNSHGRHPPILKAIGAPIARWNQDEIITVIEQAAAIRS